ncbi:LON peptidase substrate-binding domain-containing protein [Gallaecimonas sp. GXIMD4217]|uniref:LON peptidase substrate-binding domain-containing protein n=1 Tax=Gallaecimonas sp. GXIMD4217 TaxID=3131927 RepID=UPI00311B376A
MTLAQFVLDAQLLPQGRLSLRVFEPRYLRMVADAMAGRRGFGICTADPQGRLCPIGTWVDIIDFERLPDGLLGLLVQGRQRYRILSSHQEEDHLQVAEVAMLPQWPAHPMTQAGKPLSRLLYHLFELHPELAELYPERHYEDLTWVTARWLELLPLTGPQRQPLMQPDSCDPALDFLCNQLTRALS